MGAIAGISAGVGKSFVEDAGESGIGEVASKLGNLASQQSVSKFDSSSQDSTGGGSLSSALQSISGELGQLIEAEKIKQDLGSNNSGGASNASGNSTNPLGSSGNLAPDPDTSDNSLDDGSSGDDRIKGQIKKVEHELGKLAQEIGNGGNATSSSGSQFNSIGSPGPAGNVNATNIQPAL